VARILIANPSIRFRIEVGVELTNEGRHGKEADLRLTGDRARAVQTYLVGKGVKPSQLDVAGLGSDRPLDAKKPKDPRLNRRVDFIRVNQ
jgi:outer membrane protein OmpA-like peptidoglycan-associated protein